MSDIGVMVFLPPILRHLQAEAPDVAIEVRQVAAPEMLRALEIGQVDLALGNLPDLQAHTRHNRLFDERYVCVLPEGHAFIEGGLDLKTFSEARHVAVVSPFSGYQVVEDMLVQEGVRRRVVLETPHFTSAPDIIAQTDLIVTVPSRVAELFAVTHGLRCLALLAGALAAVVLGRGDASALGGFGLARSVLQAPTWSWAAMVELVVPLAITVLVVQNGQGFAVLRTAGHNPPFNATTVLCGVASLAAAAVGAVSSCLAGPTNALVASSGERGRHYTAAVLTGLLAVAFGLVAPAFTGLMLAAPKEYVMVLGGLAMLRVLQAAFVASFKGRFTLGALVAFLVTVADLGLLNIGAAFWDLVAGFAASWLLERHDFAALAEAG